MPTDETSPANSRLPVSRGADESALLWPSFGAGLWVALLQQIDDDDDAAPDGGAPGRALAA